MNYFSREKKFSALIGIESVLSSTMIDQKLINLAICNA